MNFQQQPDALLMIRPASFGFNHQTAASNAFQRIDPTEPEAISRQALEEFERMVDMLLAHEIDVRVFDDTADVAKPDAVFPNNWISFHEDGTVILYPLLAENRRTERRMDIPESLKKDFIVNRVIDLSAKEQEGKFLEGTGSLVFDHIGRVVYACRSPRTDESLVLYLADLLGYRPIIFHATDARGKPVYHTNVMMSVGEKFALVCLDSIAADADQDAVLESLGSTGRRIIAISFEQMELFAGNVLDVKNLHGEPIVLISSKALQSLLRGQRDALAEHAELLPIHVDTIERIGGGSVRCMVAGIHLKKQNTV